jgi:hypothetical protein
MFEINFNIFGWYLDPNLFFNPNINYLPSNYF